MSDLNGERAFDLITERMLELQGRCDRAERERFEAQHARFEMEQRIKNLERRLESAAADACRFRALVPPDVLKEHEAKRAASPAPVEPGPDTDLPF